MKYSRQFFKLSSVCFCSCRSQTSVSPNISQTKSRPSSSINKSLHCYRTLHPYDNADEFTKYIISCITYNKDGLFVLNKPYGIKIHSHDKPGARPKSDHQFLKPSVPECDYTIEDTLPALQEYFNVPQLSIRKSAERYSSGIVLLSSSPAVSEKLNKSFNIAKFQKKPHLVHWVVTNGYPVVSYRKEKVGIKFVETGKNDMKQPIIVTDLSKRDSKLKRVHSVEVESRTISVNSELATSLVQISTASVKWHFIKVYASSRVAPVLGDTIYGGRMKSLLGVPVKVPLHQSCESGFEHLPPKVSEILNLPSGTDGQLMIPTMLHLRSVILPNFYQKGQDFVVTVDLPTHFSWTVNRLNLLLDSK